MVVLIKPVPEDIRQSVKGAPVLTAATAKSSALTNSPHWDRLNLPRACRQIYAETASAYFETALLPFYTQVFSFDDPAELTRFLHVLVVKQAFLIRAIEIRADTFAARGEPVPWVRMANLRRVCVRKYLCITHWFMTNRLRAQTHNAKLEVVFED
ncbi:hypothetical protein BDV95DRAFT_603723 [Massariosphaeria phaeospora]|uniref:Uncharacterized protein n=1 Tax=Massariosphaeria phaeospora TaxID=100035 RepID=A0A7C8MJN6_9PLEO|nr:hypothetical protein BDV95DRAFT_603723 [Massariosphaeria phaeospora]